VAKRVSVAKDMIHHDFRTSPKVIFGDLAPWFVAVHLLGLCNDYYAAANNIALMAHHTIDAFDSLSN
jgi:hypothetical protein